MSKIQGNERKNVKKFDNKIFKNRLKERMKLKRYDIKSLAEASGLSRTSIYNWMEHGDRPKEQNLEKIADILETRPEYLAGEDDYPTERDLFEAKVESDHVYDKYINAIIDIWFKKNGYSFVKKSIKVNHNVIADNCLFIGKSINYVLKPNEELRAYIYSKKKGSITYPFANNDDLELSEQDLDLLHEEIIDFIDMRLHQISRRNTLYNARLYHDRKF